MPLREDQLLVLRPETFERRKAWVDVVSQISGDFGQDSARLEKILHRSVDQNGHDILLEHLRLCGDIPEHYDHDSTEEKLYSKYTDILLSIAFSSMGLKSAVLTERADAADVEVVGPDYSFVADAKAFRLSRTAKNQKDFKVDAMDGWKRGKPYAVVVCPIYQLPSRTSQIYFQAAARNVCILTYSHLAVLLDYASISNLDRAQKLLLEIFKSIENMNPSKDAVSYWTAVNRSILEFDEIITDLWDFEKRITVDTIRMAKEEALEFLAREREKIMRMSHNEAIGRLIEAHKLPQRATIIQRAADNNILSRH